MTYVLRTQGEPMSELPAVRTAMEEIDRNRAIIDPRTEEFYWPSKCSIRGTTRCSWGCLPLPPQGLLR
jgi:hypothetical protein